MIYPGDRCILLSSLVGADGYYEVLDSGAKVGS